MSFGPRYLRVVVTARCSLACAFCHQEGDPATAHAGGLPGDELDALLAVAVDQGVRKLKLLGGEPLLRRDLPDRIAAARARAPGLDISLITAGAVEVDRLDACFEAGLSRANMSVHGCALPAFQARTGRGEAAFARREAVLARLLERGRPLKLNYVWRGPQDDADLGLLLARAAGWPVVVGVLDDLGCADLGPRSVRAAVERLRGPAPRAWAEPDPDSLPTLRLQWRDGLTVEIKDHHLGQEAPWRACAACPRQGQCREGIHALRLTHDGRLRPCMDRPDVGVDLRSALRRGGPPAAALAWHAAVRQWARPASLPVPPLAA
ncbi:radical SAM protein [Myxococcota bacterium]|nr:radical SAM protein [Myxococcota bacterium]